MNARAPIALLAAALFAGCGSAGEGPILKRKGPPAVSGPLTLTPIRFATTDPRMERRVIDAEEGVLRVPERHGRPDGREISVHFVRFDSTSSQAGPPIVYLAGGPGGSGTWSASGDRFPLFQQLREVADVIAYDQRGTWGTNPYMICPGSWSYPLDRPMEEETIEAAMKPYLNRCWEHWSKKADLSAYNTVESAEDLEALRRALGAEKLTLWGISYGTHLALAYIRAHPDRVHRAILAGVEGPDHTYKLPSRIDAVVHRAAEAVRADPQARPLLPDLVGAVEQALARLEEQPATVDVKGGRVVVGANDLRRGVYSALGEREDIAELLKRGLPVLRGDFTGLAESIAESRAENRSLVMSLSMDCASGATASRRATIGEQGKTALVGDVVNARLRAACAHWPVKDLGDDYRSAVRGDMPVLFISGTLDVKTPPANAEDVLPGFPNGHHLVIDGGSHDDDLFLASPEIAKAMLGFLRGQPVTRRVELEPLRFELP